MDESSREGQKAVVYWTILLRFFVLIFFCVGVMYSGEYDACDVTLSVYPHRASLKNMPGHSGNRTYNLWNTSPMICQLFFTSYYIVRNHHTRRLCNRHSC